jgi:hypothetical protein
MPDPTLSCWLGGTVRDHAHAADQAVRGIIHLTLLPHPIPAPDVYQILAELEDLAFALARVLRHHLGRALEASLTDPRVYDLRDPATSVHTARDRLDQAGTHVYAAGLAVSAARAAIADQGYHADTPAAVTQ